MNLNKIVRQFSEVLDRLASLERKVDSLTAPQSLVDLFYKTPEWRELARKIDEDALTAGKVDSQPTPATIATQQVSERPHRTLTLPRKESAGGYSRAKRETAGGD